MKAAVKNGSTGELRAMLQEQERALRRFEMFLANPATFGY